MRQQRLNEIAGADMTHILLESPKRLLHTLDDLIDQCGLERQACVAREMTKLHEVFICGSLNDVKNRLDATIRGEIVVIIGPCEDKNIISDEEIILLLKQTDIENLPPSARARQVARVLSIPRSRVYALMMQEKKEKS